MDLTNATLAELKARKKEVEELLASGTVTIELTDERNMIMNKISELGGNEEESVEDETDQVVVRALEEIDLFGVPLGMYFADVTDHISVRTVVLAKVRQLQQDILDVESSTAREIKELKDDAFDLNDTISQLHNEISKLKAELYEAKLEVGSNATKRDNAYNELLEAKQTIDELNDKLTAATAPKAPTLTNLDGAAGYVKKEKRVIYDVQGKGKNKFTAKYADTDEEFEDYTIYMDGKYRVVEKAEADTFREQYMVEHPAEVVETAPEVEPTAPPIREEDSTGSELVTEAPTVDRAISAEERLYNVENRLDRAEHALRSMGINL